MTRINTNVASLVAMSDLFKSNQSMETSLQRLSSGLRINTAKDDPAGLIISEMLRSEMTSISQAIDNTERASNVIATAEGALNEVSSLLNDVRDLVVEAASTGSLTAEEIDANQLQIDSAVESITRIANSTTFGGTQLLNGNLDFQIAEQADVAGEVAKTRVFDASFGSASHVDMAYDLSAKAAEGQVDIVHADGSAYTLEVTGNKGSMTFSFAAASNATSMVDQIVSAVNAATDVTGVTATDGAATAEFLSEKVGSDQFVSVRVVSGTTPQSIGGTAGATSGTDKGTDVAGTVNGQSFVGKGDVATVNNGNIKAEITFDSATYAANSDGTLRISGGGAKFQIGQEINSNGQVRLGIQSITASNLGGGTAPGVLSSIVTGGTNSLLEGKQADAAAIVDKAILDIATMRGRLGAVQRNTLDTNVNSLQVTLENLTSSESTIRDTDFAKETAQLTRNQILVQAGMSVLATANSTPQSVLSLLGG
jgi:flagellin